MKKILFAVTFIWLLSGVSWAAWVDGEIKTFVFQQTCDGSLPSGGIPAAYQCVDVTSASLSPQTTTIDGDSVVWGWDSLTGLLSTDIDEACVTGGEDCIAGTAGYVYKFNNGTTQRTFNVTLPGTSIDYQIKLLVGNSCGGGSTAYPNVQVFDNATEKFRISHTTVGNCQYYDAGDNLITVNSLQADITNQAGFTYSAASTAFKVKIGSLSHDGGGAGGDISPIAFLSIKRVGTTGTTTSTTTTTSTSTTTTTSTSTTTTTLAAGNYDLEVQTMTDVSSLVSPWRRLEARQITLTIYNRGTDDLVLTGTDQFLTNIFLCPTSVTFSWTCVGKVNVGIFAYGPGTLGDLGNPVYTTTVALAMPGSAAIGTYNAGAFVDSTLVITEAAGQEADNVFQTAGTVTVAGPLTQFEQGWNFRNTSNFIADLGGQTPFTQAQVYPFLFPGSSPANYFGMTPSSCAVFYDSSTTYTPELAGAMGREGSAQCDIYFQTGGPGTYSLYLAMGATVNGDHNHTCLYAYDGQYNATTNNVPFLTIENPSVNPGAPIDATNAAWTFTTMKNSQGMGNGLNVGLQQSLVHVKLGCSAAYKVLNPSAENEFSYLRHFRLSSNSFVPPTTTTTTSTTSTTTTTTSTTTTTTTLPSSPYCPTSTFSWTAPTQFTDGTLISAASPANPITGYKIFVCDRGIPEGTACTDTSGTYLRRTYTHNSLSTSLVFNTFDTNNLGIGVMGPLGDSSGNQYGIYVANIVAFTATAQSLTDPALERRFNYASLCIPGSTLPPTTTTSATTTTTTSTSTTTTTGTILGSGPDVRFNFPLNVVNQVISGGYIQMTVGQAYQVLVDLAYSDIGGSDASGTFDVLLYIDTITPANLLTTYAHPTMADNATVQTTLSFNVPLATNIGPGHYLVAVLSGISVDGNPNNNVSYTTPAININAPATTTTTTTTTTSTTATTLAVGAANYRNSITPFITGGFTTLFVGSNYDVQFNVINDGTVDATAVSTVRITLSEDQVCDPQDTVLGSQQIPALLYAGNPLWTLLPNYHMQVTIPPFSSGFSSGSFFLCSQVDFFNNIVELNENNTDQTLASTLSVSVAPVTTTTISTTTTTSPPFTLILPRDDTRSQPCELTYPATCSDSAIRGDIINRNSTIHFLSYGAAQQGAALGAFQLTQYQFALMPLPSAGHMPVYCTNCIEGSYPASDTVGPGPGIGTTCSVVNFIWKCE